MFLHRTDVLIEFRVARLDAVVLAQNESFSETTVKTQTNYHCVG